MNCKEIITKYLKENNFDGLFNRECNCGCPIDDLMPMDDCWSDCEPGHKVPCDPETCPAEGDCEFHIGEK